MVLFVDSQTRPNLVYNDVQRVSDSTRVSFLLPKVQDLLRVTKADIDLVGL